MMLRFEIVLKILFNTLLLSNLFWEIQTDDEPVSDEEPAFNDTTPEPVVDIKVQLELLLQENLAELRAEIRNLTLQNQQITETNRNLRNELTEALSNMQTMNENPKVAQTERTPAEREVLPAKDNGNSTGTTAEKAVSDLEETHLKRINASITVPQDCLDNKFFANCNLILKADYCSHKYYKQFCCETCTLAGKLPGV